MHALNDILLIAAAVAFAGAAAALTLISQKDFVEASEETRSETRWSSDVEPEVEWAT